MSQGLGKKGEQIKDLSGKYRKWKWEGGTRKQKKDNPGSKILEMQFGEVPI